MLIHRVWSCGICIHVIICIHIDIEYFTVHKDGVVYLPSNGALLSLVIPL